MTSLKECMRGKSLKAIMLPCTDALKSLKLEKHRNAVSGEEEGRDTVGSKKLPPSKEFV